MISLLGVCLLPLVAWLFSTNRKAVNPRTVFGAFAIQAAIGGFVLYVPAGKQIVEVLAIGVSNVLIYSQEGINFLFGGLVGESIGFVFALNVLPVIVFFSSLITVLYYLGVMDWIVKLIGGFLQKVLGTSRPESLSAAANIFIGQTEAPLVVKPFLPKMTDSELFAIMVGGMASIAGSVMAGYAGLGVDIKYLLAASFMAAPGGLMMAKLFMPETEEPNNDLIEINAEEEEEDTHVNIFDAAAAGALTGLQIALAVGAMLLAFIALIAMLNGILGWFTGLFGVDGITIEIILGYAFQPVAWLLGVPWHEANIAGSFIGQKLVLNEFVAFVNFADVIDTLTPKSQAIITFALCGFANFSSIAICLGGIGTLAPSRRKDLARLGMRALMAATLANLMSAALAGFFLSLG
ncbi:MAG: CNT family concentrative nucleoside transporter [Candidatus Azotimanducaceae bacterium]|jgi:CNT family concentrative nucleoside transporter